MAIQLVLGPAGSGKTEYMMSELISGAEKHPELNYLYVVPEQFTMEAQRDIVTRHPRHGTMNIDAIGFNRLAYRVFDELSVNPGQVLEDFGKSMLIQRILMEKSDELLMYKGYMNRQGFIDEMKSMLSELFQYTVGGQDIEDAMEKLDRDGALYRKLHDVKLIYDSFNEYNRDRYIVAEQLVELLAGLLPQSDFLKKSILYFDGFTGFTPAQMVLIRGLMKHSMSLTFAFTISADKISLARPKEYELSRLTRETMINLCHAAKEEHVDIRDNVVMCDASETPRRYKNSPELAALERNLFRYPHGVYAGHPENIRLAAAQRARDEAMYVASQIRALVSDKENDFRYRDIAVVVGDLTEVAMYYRQAMKEYDIPVFIDANMPLTGDPCTDSIKAFLAVMRDNFTYDSVFRLLKSGLVGITYENGGDGGAHEVSMFEIERMENYVLKKNMRGYGAWTKKIETSESRERVRAGFMELFTASCLDVYKPQRPGSKATVKEYTKELYSFMRDNRMFEKLEYRRKKLYEENRQDEGDAYGSIFDKVVTLFDKIVTLLGDVRMTVREYADVLDAGIQDMEIGIVPPTIDRVLVGDMTRSRMGRVRVLFFTGVNEGIIPKPSKKGRILSAADRDRLKDCGVNLAPSDKTNSYIEQFYIYTNLTKPSDRLYLVYRRQAEDGSASGASYLIDRVRGVFPQLKAEEYDMYGQLPETAAGVLRYVSSRAQSGGSCKGLLDVLGGEYDRELRAITDGRNYVNHTVPLTPETLKRLYGEELCLSVSRLERYAECQYKYFIQYGLGLRERELAEVNAANIGNILHSTMERLFTRVKEVYGNNWENIARTDLDRETELCVDAASEAEAGDYFADSERAGYMKKLISDVAVNSAHTLREFIRCGELKPSEFEKSFDTSPDKDNIPGYTFDLVNDMKMSFKGVIDRIDEYTDGGDLYFKIIDYKSSAHSLSENRVLSGLQLQLMTYAAIAMELEKRKLAEMGEEGEVHLGGAFYFTFDDPVADAGDMLRNMPFPCKYGADGITAGETGTFEDSLDELYERLRAGEMKYSGIYDESAHIAKLLDRQSGAGAPSIKPRTDKKSYNLIEELMAANRRNVHRLAQELAGGSIDINPVMDGDVAACKYCDYKGICAFDTKYSGNSFTRPYTGNDERYADVQKKLEKLGELEKSIVKLEKKRDKAAEKNKAAADKVNERGEKATEKQKQTLKDTEKALREAETELEAARTELATIKSGLGSLMED